MPGDLLDHCHLHLSGCHIFENNFRIKHKFAKYLKGSCGYSNGDKFSFKYFLYIAFVREISPRLSEDFGRYRHKWVKGEILIRIQPATLVQILCKSKCNKPIVIFKGTIAPSDRTCHGGLLA